MSFDTFAARGIDDTKQWVAGSRAKESLIENWLCAQEELEAALKAQSAPSSSREEVAGVRAALEAVTAEKSALQVRAHTYM